MLKPPWFTPQFKAKVALAACVRSLAWAPARTTMPHRPGVHTLIVIHKAAAKAMAAPLDRQPRTSERVQKTSVIQIHPCFTGHAHARSLPFSRIDR